jgi:hypothetical protein
MRRRGRKTGETDAAAIKVLDEAGRAYPGRQLASIRIGGPVTMPRSKCRIAHQRFGAVSRRIRVSRSTASIRR